MVEALFTLIVFPGFLFLGAAGVLAEFADRKLYARLQNRQGPPWFQPVADFVKLASKEDIVPAKANHFMFKLVPMLAVTAATVPIVYIPIWSSQALFSFSGDMIVVIYLLTIPTLSFFLGGWFSTSLYSMIGALRTLTQLFAYEVPLFLALLAPAVVAGTWSLSGISVFYAEHPLLILTNLLGLAVALISIQGKLERTPFDIPEAETEIVGGTFTEYSGRLLALFRMSIDIELVVCCSIVAAVFLPFGLNLGPVAGFVLYVAKVAFVLFLLALMRTVLARFRIEQMVVFCWKYVAPAAFLQLLISVLVRGWVNP
ncbi:MAG: NADH dehydrogenase [Bdellovibrionales bacterium RIFOXYC1_FULL_54_43]|nr:MAG: NADH dehydrogenase [Bdellovibrionales bacterium RIFOXYC1_FULL_54_43]